MIMAAKDYKISFGWRGAYFGEGEQEDTWIDVGRPKRNQ